MEEAFWKMDIWEKFSIDTWFFLGGWGGGDKTVCHIEKLLKPDFITELEEVIKKCISWSGKHCQNFYFGPTYVFEI